MACKIRRNSGRLRHHRVYILVIATIAVTVSTYIEKVSCFPSSMYADNVWPSFPRRNVAALARAGYIKGSINGIKRSLAILAKNGQLPTLRAPYDGIDKAGEGDDESAEKRNVASIARMRSFPESKRNIQSLARDGYLAGRGQTSRTNDKRENMDDYNEQEYYYPFYQNSIPPLSEVDGPIDANEWYDYQQSVNPDMFPPLSQAFKRSNLEPIPQIDFYGDTVDDMGDYRGDSDNNWYLKRGIVGLPMHGILRTSFRGAKGKRSYTSLDINNDIDSEIEGRLAEKKSVDIDDEKLLASFEKRHIGSLARLGLLPSFRFSGGRYSRSGRAKLLLPSQELYRKHSPNENIGIRQYIPSAEVEAADDGFYSDISPPTVLANSHPTGRFLQRPLTNEILPFAPAPPYPLPQLHAKNIWYSQTKDNPKFYHFRSLKIPHRKSNKRYLLLPAVDNIMLRKTYPNSSLPSRRKNQ